jgi:regulator of protease activity HflC (stomatin/prohibitin superfamily)
MGYIIAAILGLLLLILITTNIRIVPQSEAYVIERLGAYLTTWNTGLHFKIPLIDRISKKVSLKEIVADFPPQPVITKDNVTMKIDTVIFFQITDPKLYTYGVTQPMFAIESITATTLRNLIGELELDESLSSRDIINTQMRLILDVATDPWGIKVNRVELKNILPPKDIQDAMEKQMRAERERRESILRAEGEKSSTILIAEGQKESVILRAEAEKQSAILYAESRKVQQIREAEGEGEAIMLIQKATAEGLEMIKAINVDQSVITLKGLETFVALSNGQATKMIIPTNLTQVGQKIPNTQILPDGQIQAQEMMDTKDIEISDNV